MKETIKGIHIKSLFSRNLKRLRTTANLSQLNLATDAELTHNFINDIENGKKWVSAETIAKLAIALKAEPYQFFISDSKWNNKGAEIFSLYLDDLSDSFGKMIKEYRGRYLTDDAADEEKESLHPPSPEDSSPDFPDGNSDGFTGCSPDGRTDGISDGIPAGIPAGSTDISDQGFEETDDNGISDNDTGGISDGNTDGNTADSPPDKPEGD